MGWNQTPGPVARLGRPVGTVRPFQGAVLLLPDGRPVSRRPRFAPATAGPLPLARRLVREAGPEGLVVHAVRYRRRGGDGRAADPVADVRGALDEVQRRYGDIPVCLVGTGVGARTALRAAGHAAVEAVAALATWLPPVAEDCCQTTADSPCCDPVEQLAGRQVLLVHGTEDRRSDPEHAFRWALRAKQVTERVCRFEAHGDGHGLYGYRREVRSLVVDFVLGALYAQDFARPLTDALLAPTPLGLRMPLASGFGQAPHRPRGVRRAVGRRGR